MARALVFLSMAVISAAAASTAYARTPARFDLGAATVDGRTIIGRSLADVTAGWGRPTARRPTRG